MSEWGIGDVGSTTADGPRTSRGERTAARLRDAARKAFADLGYAAVRVEDIVAEAGVSHGTFYTYFDNKGAALDALIDETSASLLSVVEESWEGEHAAETIEAVIARFVDVFAADADVIRTWLEATAHESHFRERLREVRDGYVQRVADQLEPALRDTEHAPQSAAAALVAMVEGYATEMLSDDDLAQRERTVKVLAAIWYGGLLRLSET